MTDILDLQMQENDAEAPTIRAYLARLAREMWVEGEGADGKRPFGNSGWHQEVLDVLYAGELIDNDDAGDRLIREALARMELSVVPEPTAAPEPEPIRTWALRLPTGEVKKYRGRMEFSGDPFATPGEVTIKDDVDMVVCAQGVSVVERVDDVPGWITVDKAALERLLRDALHRFDANASGPDVDDAPYAITPHSVPNMAAHMIESTTRPPDNPVDQDEADRNREAEVAEAEAHE